MSAEIGPGVWVEAIETSQMRDVVKGDIRLVERMVAVPDSYDCKSCGALGGFALILKGLPLTPRSIGYCPNHWRPIFRDQQSVTRSLEMPTDANPPRVDA